MSTLTVREKISNALSVNVTDDTLLVELDDGRAISVPTAWYPRLFHASKEERNDWRFIGKGMGYIGTPLIKISALKDSLQAGRRGNVNLP